MIFVGDTVKLKQSKAKLYVVAIIQKVTAKSNTFCQATEERCNSNRMLMFDYGTAKVGPLKISLGLNS